MTERMTGCCVSWKCLVACPLGEASQQPTWLHVRHSRRATQCVFSMRHSSQAFGAIVAGKSADVRPFKCSHGFGVGIVFSLIIYRVFAQKWMSACRATHCVVCPMLKLENGTE